MPRWTGTAEERLLAKVQKTDSCWLWLASLGTSGYGQIWDQDHRRAIGAHRLAYKLWVGPLTDSQDVDHICHVKRCVNPEHLQLMDPGWNASRWAREKTHCPQGHPLVESNVYVTRTPAGYPGRKCATCHKAQQRNARAALRIWRSDGGSFAQWTCQPW